MLTVTQRGNISPIFHHTHPTVHYRTHKCPRPSVFRIYFNVNLTIYSKVLSNFPHNHLAGTRNFAMNLAALLDGLYLKELVSLQISMTTLSDVIWYT